MATSNSTTLTKTGLATTNGDKNRIAEDLLRQHPEWSDRKIARHAGAGRTFVGKLRRHLAANEPSLAMQMRQSENGRTINTAKIGNVSGRRGVTGNRIVKPGYVYVIASPSGCYKIGCTSRPQSRLKYFGVELPFEIEVTCLIRTEDMFALESALHLRFADRWIKGEWFALTSDDLEYLASLGSTA